MSKKKNENESKLTIYEYEQKYTKRENARGARLLLILIGPVISVVSALTLTEMGVSYYIWIILFCGGFLAPPIATLLLAKRLDMNESGLKRMRRAVYLSLIAIACILASPHTKNPNSGTIAVVFGSWIISLGIFLHTQTLIPGHPKKGAVSQINKLSALGIICFAYGLFSFVSSFI